MNPDNYMVGQDARLFVIDEHTTEKMYEIMIDDILGTASGTASVSTSYEKTTQDIINEINSNLGAV